MKVLAGLFFFVSLAHAQIGEIISLRGGTDATLTRNGEKTLIQAGTPLEVGDLLRSETAYVTLILNPKIQMGLSKGSELRITQHMVDEAAGEVKTESLIELVKGLIRVQVTRDQNEKVNQKVEAGGVAFAVRGTEFEVSSSTEDAELDVIEGEVEVTSPHVQTFVPEIVKANQGFRYGKKSRSFDRREFRQRLKEANFLKREELRSRWQKKKALKAAKRASKRKDREERKASRREKRNRGH